MRSIPFPVIFVWLGSMFSAGAGQAAEEEKENKESVMARIDALAASGRLPSGRESEDLGEAIERSAKEVAQAIMERLAKEPKEEKRLPIYVWALGITKEPKAAEAVIGVYRRIESKPVREQCLGALGRIGGKPAGDFLLTLLEKEKEEEKRYGILCLLGQLHHEPALAKAADLLALEPRKFYWRSVFVFAQMGDVAVPFLLKKIEDSNPSVRANAILLLGPWLAAPEAFKPLLVRYWKEEDPDNRADILSASLSTAPDLDKEEKFLDEVLAKEKHEQLKEAGRKCRDGLANTRKAIADFQSKKKVSKTDFQEAWTDIYKSAGKKGDYKKLAAASSIEDESKLEALRERILQRYSDEAFYDYQKVNDIIIFNRRCFPPRNK
jgi:HEAT repeat protein